MFAEMAPLGALAILAAGGVDLQIPTSLDTHSRGALGGALPVLLAILVMVAGLVVWAVFIRKPARRRDRGRLIESKPKSSDESDDSHSSRRRRRRRGRNRQPNPTLADTGGLPPIGAGDAKSPPL